MNVVNNKIWFIFQWGHHRGPYTTQEIKRMLKNGILKETQLCWKFGLESWKKIKDLPGLLEEKEKKLFLDSAEEHYVDFEFPFPEVAQWASSNRTKITDFVKGHSSKISEKGSEKISQAKQLIDSKLTARFIARVAANIISTGKKLSGQLITKSYEILLKRPRLLYHNLFLETDFKVQIGLPKLNLQPLKVILLSLLVVAGGTGVKTLYKGHKIREKTAPLLITKPKLMNKNDFSRLKKAVDSTTSPGVFEAAIASDGSLIWVAGRSEKNLYVKITGVSVNGKVLSERPIKFTLEGNFDSPLTSFKKMTLLAGTSLRPGVYELQIQEHGKSSKVNRERSHFKTTANYLPKGTKLSELEEKIKKFNHQSNLKRFFPLRETIEKLKTFFGMTEGIVELFSREVALIKKGKEMSAFETKYSKYFGVLLRDIGLSEIKKGNKEEKSVLYFGKKIGGKVIANIQKVKKFGKLGLARKKFLVESFKKDFSSIQKELQTKILSLNKVLEENKLTF